MGNDVDNSTFVLLGGYNSSDTNVTGLSEERRTAYLIAAIYLTIVGIAAIVGNILVLVVILRDHRLRNKCHNLLLINLATTDLMCLLGGYPFTTISGYLRYWAFSAFVCKYAAFFTFFMCQTSMNTLVAICVFRYIMICYPGKAFLLTKKLTFYIICLCWFHSLFWTGVPLMGWGSYGAELFEISCSLRWADHSFSSTSYLVGCIIFCYVVHVATMVRCYKHISRTVTSLAIRDRERSRGVVTMDEMMHKNTVADDTQVTKMCFLVVTVYVGVWTPYALISTIHIFYSDLPLAIIALPSMAAKASCMLNPVVYFASNRSFRSKAFKMLCCANQGNAVGVDLPKRSQEAYDKISKDGVYLGRHTINVERQSTMF